jgi:CRISPR/Cas system-associated exonuclease Cas4 (RecB family)
MKLINVTNDHHRLVNNQLDGTDAYLAEVYSAGNTTIIYTEARTHNEIVLYNKRRNILDKEIDEVKRFFQKKMKNQDIDFDNVDLVRVEGQDGLVELSYKKNK